MKANFSVIPIPALVLGLPFFLVACSAGENSLPADIQSLPDEVSPVAISGDEIPRLENGTVNLGPPPGETGFWLRTNGTLVNNPDSYEANRRNANTARVDMADVPLQPWARALTNFRHDVYLASEPYARCKPAPGPRQIMSPYGFEIIQMPEIQRIYILTISNAMSYRTIYMDGRQHPEEIIRPTYFGHSIGHWEDDTLVVDTIGLSEKSWMSRDGLPTTEQFHMTERFTRFNTDEMDYTVTIDDPGAYTSPWTSGFGISWNAGAEMFEYICQQNNISPESMIGDGRVSVVVP